MIERLQEKWLSDAEEGRFEKALETYYMENRVGTFEMTCRYQPNEDIGLGHKILTSPPVRFYVRNDGTFTDPLMTALSPRKLRESTSYCGSRHRMNKISDFLVRAKEGQSPVSPDEKVGGSLTTSLSNPVERSR